MFKFRTSTRASGMSTVNRSYAIKMNTHGTDFARILSRFIMKRVAYEFLLSGTRTSGQNDINGVW